VHYPVFENGTKLLLIPPALRDRRERLVSLIDNLHRGYVEKAALPIDLHTLGVKVILMTRSIGLLKAQSRLADCDHVDRARREAYKLFHKTTRCGRPVFDGH
jgi:hypothetical protein